MLATQLCLTSIIALLAAAPATSFSVSFASPGANANLRLVGTAAAPLFAHQTQTSGGLPDHPETSPQDGIQRREFLITAAAAAAASATVLPFAFMQPALASDDEISSSSASASASALLGSICVIGANGKTGSECVGACIARGINVVATSRGGVYAGLFNTNADENASLLSSKVCDVTVPSTIATAIQGSRAVIFAASASKAGGTAAAVDNVGLVNVARACIENKVPHLVIVSSGAVTKPDSPVYKFLNIFGNIMEEKIKGEDAVRAMFKDSDVSTYTVIRPGGLTEEAAKGVTALELNQGDTKSGRIARADVAALCIEATNFSKVSTGGTTFECYDADTAKPLGTVGFSNIMKQKNKGSDEVFVSGKERRGATFGEIFTGLEQDSRV